MNYSLTYTGAIATLLAYIGIMDNAEALTFVNASAVVITTLITLYGRWRKGDVTILGVK